MRRTVIQNVAACPRFVTLFRKDFSTFSFPEFSAILMPNRPTKICVLIHSINLKKQEHTKFGLHAYNSLEKHGLYKVFYLNDSKKIDMDLLQFWSRRTNLPISIQNALSNSFTHFLMILESDKVSCSVQNNYYFLLIVFTPNTLLLNISSNNDMVQNKEILENLDYPIENSNGTLKSLWTACDVNINYNSYYKLRNKTENYFFQIKDKPSFRNFKIWMSTDLIIFYEMLATKKEEYDERYAGENSVKFISGSIYFQHENAFQMAIDEDGLEFLTCGGITHGSLSLTGYISAFDKWIWIWALIISLLTSSLFIFIRLFCDFLCQGRLIDQVIMPIYLSLEQGNDIAGNVNQHNFLYFLCGGWILATLILSNAYKGQNITDLTQPLPAVKPQYFADLVNQNFSIYCKAIGAYFVGFAEIFTPFLRSHDLDNPNREYSGNVLRYLLNSAQQNKVMAKYQSILNTVQNLT